MYFKNLKMIYLIKNTKKCSFVSAEEYNVKIKNKDIRTFEEIKNESIVNFTVIKNKQKILYTTINDDEMYGIYKAFEYGHLDIIKWLNVNNCLNVNLVEALGFAFYKEHIDILNYYVKFIQNNKHLRVCKTLKIYQWFLENKIKIYHYIYLPSITDYLFLKILITTFFKFYLKKVKRYIKHRWNHVKIFNSLRFKTKNKYIKGYNKN